MPAGKFFARRRLAVFDEGQWRLCPAPGLPTAQDLVSRYDPPWAPGQDVVGSVRGNGWVAGSHVVKSLDYREASMWRLGDTRSPVEFVCALWPDPRRVLATMKEAAAQMWASSLERHWRKEPHASIFRHMRSQQEKAVMLSGLRLLLWGIADDMWNVGFPQVPETRGFPQMSALPYLVGLGFMPLGCNGPGSVVQVCLYDAAA